MTEQEWLQGEDLEAMLRHLNDKVSERKFRLTECAFLRRFWHLLTDERNRRAVEAAEQFADGTISREGLRAAEAHAQAAYHDLRHAYFADRGSPRSFWGGVVSAAQHTASSFYDMPDLFAHAETPERFRAMSNLIWIGTAAYPIGVKVSNRKGHNAIKAEHAAQAVLLRDLFGNPFHPATIQPSWLVWNDGTIPKMAQAIYNDRAFDRLPVLADALEDAGCQDADILGHCRQPGPHVLGCWLIDLLTRKE